MCQCTSIPVGKYTSFCLFLCKNAILQIICEFCVILLGVFLLLFLVKIYLFLMLLFLIGLLVVFVAFFYSEYFCLIRDAVNVLGLFLNYFHLCFAFICHFVALLLYVCVFSDVPPPVSH